MNFLSTRDDQTLSPEQLAVCTYGKNGGLFVPATLPVLTAEDFAAMSEMDFPERMATVVAKFIDVDTTEFVAYCEKVFSQFQGEDPIPLVKLDDGIFMSELYHGPTCSSKDIAAQMLPFFAKKANKPVTYLTATVGDFGKAAACAFNGEDYAKTVSLYPDDGISKMQRFLLCCKEAKNTSTLGLKGGSLDECRKAVRSYILSHPEKTIATADELNACVLIINVAGFVSAYVDMVDSEQIEQGEEIDFACPSVDLGTAVAAYYAAKMGVPVRKIHLGTNENSCLVEFFNTGKFDGKRELIQTTVAGLDTTCPANIERLVYEATGRSSEKTAHYMAELEQKGSFTLSSTEMSALKMFHCGFAKEEDCVETIYDVFCDVGYTMDMHAGCAMKVVVDWFEKNKKDETNVVIIADVNPYKYPQDVLYCVTGNDVKDSFKGVKRLHAATAMVAPKAITALRDTTPDQTTMVKLAALPEALDALV